MKVNTVGHATLVQMCKIYLQHIANADSNERTSRYANLFRARVGRTVVAKSWPILVLGVSHYVILLARTSNHIDQESHYRPRESQDGLLLLLVVEAGG
jgi:hypothetical protein